MVETHNQVAEFLGDVLPSRNSAFKHNAVQLDYAGAVSRGLSHGSGTFHFLEGDTGIGKSLAYLLNLADWVARGIRLGRKAVIATHSRALQRQLLDDKTLGIVDEYLKWADLPTLKIGLRMGRVNYVAPHRLARCLDVDSLTDLVNNPKATSNQKALAQWGLRGGMLHEISEEMLPEGTSLSDIALHQSDELPEAVREAFETTQQSDIQVLNHALLAIDLVQGNQITDTAEPTALLLDEAEHFPSVAKSMLSDRLSLWRASQILRSHNQKSAAKDVIELFDLWKSDQMSGTAKALTPAMKETLKATLTKIIRSKVTPSASKELKFELNELKDMATRIRAEINGKGEQLALTFSNEKGYPSIVMLNDTAGGILKSGHMARVTLLTSATLSDCRHHSPDQPPSFDYLRRQLLLPAGDSRLTTQVSFQAQHFGHLSFRIPGFDLPTLVNKEPGDYRLSPALCKAVWDDLETLDTKGRTLLLCVSYNDVDALLTKMPSAFVDRVVTHQPGEALTPLANSLPTDGILLTPAGWEGLSPDRDNEAFWSHVGIVRNPTPRPDPIQELIRERWLAKSMQPIDARRASKATLSQEGMVQTLHKLRQGIGRAIRHPADESTVTFYDPRFPVEPNNRGKVRELGWLVNAVPFRFKGSLLAAQQRGDKASPDADMEVKLEL